MSSSFACKNGLGKMDCCIVYTSCCVFLGFWGKTFGGCMLPWRPIPFINYGEEKAGKIIHWHFCGLPLCYLQSLHHWSLKKWCDSRAGCCGRFVKSRVFFFFFFFLTGDKSQTGPPSMRHVLLPKGLSYLETSVLMIWNVPGDVEVTAFIPKCARLLCQDQGAARYSERLFLVIGLKKREKKAVCLLLWFLSFVELGNSSKKRCQLRGTKHGEDFC